MRALDAEGWGFLNEGACEVLPVQEGNYALDLLVLRHASIADDTLELSAHPEPAPAVPALPSVTE